MDMRTDLYYYYRRVANTSTLSFALLLIGAGTGLLLGYVIEQASYYVDDGVAYLSMLFICGGLGLVGSYLIEGRKLKAEEKNKPGE